MERECYYNSEGKQVSKAVFEEERRQLLAERKAYAENPENCIPYEDLDYYLSELKKYRS